MARNGSGTYSLPAGNPVVTGTTISSTVHNNTTSDIATALTGSLAKDGQTTPTADLPMGTYKHTGVGNASARNQYAAAGQIQDQGFTWCSTAGGTANAFTLTPSPAITAYAAGQVFVFLAVGTNTTSVTCTVSGVGARAVQASGSALVGGEVVSGKLYSIRYDGTQFQLETVSVTPFIATLLNDATAAAARTTLGAIGAADNNTFTGSNTQSTGSYKFNDGIQAIFGSTSQNFIKNNGADLQIHTSGLVNFLNLASSANVQIAAAAGTSSDRLIQLGQTLGLFGSGTGYIKFPIWNGSSVIPAILHWVTGVDSGNILADATTTQTVNFNIAGGGFPGALLFATASLYYGGSARTILCNIQSQSATGATVAFYNAGAGGSSATPLVWAVGY